MKKQFDVKHAKFIYNPHAGGKRQTNPLQTKVTLEQIKNLLQQYQIAVDYFPTKYPKHATKLAREAKKEGYSLVIAAGGDGTIGEVINGLVGTDMVVGILPLGTIMNVARMLSIPLTIENAVQTLKIGRVRKIDVGSVTRIEGEKMDEPYYFLEQGGIGLDAVWHYYVSGLFDKKRYANAFLLIKSLILYFGHKVDIYCDDEKIQTKAILVTVSNGPLGGPALTLAPEAKLNDHKLTVSLFEMNRVELCWHLLQLFLRKKGNEKKITTYQADRVRIETSSPEMVHTDARLYGKTPVVFKVVPNALNIITGFPQLGQSSFNKRTYLDL